ncbi:MAG: hypothetical protein ACRETX_14635, partial [Steroidobacteraceae bacterium]
MRRVLVPACCSSARRTHRRRDETGLVPDPWFSTFSIIALDPATNEPGVGVPRPFHAPRGAV